MERTRPAPHPTLALLLLLLRPLPLLTVACVSGPWPADRNLVVVESFRDALAEDDLESARRWLAEDPRVWWGTRTGEGSPWILGQGRWKAWDEHFRGEGRALGWTARGDTVTSVIVETNDYYRLTERGPERHRRTYFLDDRGRITGTMISSIEEEGDGRDGRADEFDAWLRERYPEEYVDLRPGGEIDPTGTRAARTRAFLEEWRREVGLPTLDER